MYKEVTFDELQVAEISSQGKQNKKERQREH